MLLSNSNVKKSNRSAEVRFCKIGELFPHYARLSRLSRLNGLGTGSP